MLLRAGNGIQQMKGISQALTVAGAVWHCVLLLVQRTTWQSALFTWWSRSAISSTRTLRPRTCCACTSCQTTMSAWQRSSFQVSCCELPAQGRRHAWCASMKGCPHPWWVAASKCSHDDEPAGGVCDAQLQQSGLSQPACAAAEGWIAVQRVMGCCHVAAKISRFEHHVEQPAVRQQRGCWLLLAPTCQGTRVPAALRTHDGVPLPCLASCNTRI
jgi:hypothetical protein